MEFPEGNYTPNFSESGCSLRILGIAWKEESPRSFRETPRITSPNKDSRDSRVQAFSAQRTSDTLRPTKESSSVESIIERVCSQICNDLRRSGVLKDEIVAARVYSELSSRCIRRSTDLNESVPASPASGRSSLNKRNENTSQENRNSSKSSRVSSRARSAHLEIATTSRSASSVSRNLTRSGTPAHGQRVTSANSVSSRGRVLESRMNKHRQTPSPSFRQTSSPSIQSIQSTPRTTEGRSFENIQDRTKSIPSGSKQDNNTLLLDQPKPQNNESPTSIGKECASSRSSASHIPVRTRTPRVKDCAQITSNEDKIGQASSPIAYRKTKSESGHFNDKVDRRKSVDTEIEQCERKIGYSSQVLSTVSSVGFAALTSTEDAYKQKMIDDTKHKSSKLASETSSSSQTSMKVSSSRSSKIPIRSVTPEVTKPANAKANDNPKRLSNEKFENAAKNVSGREIKGSNEIVKKATKKPSVPKAGQKKEENTQMNALKRRKSYEAKRKLERNGVLTAKTAKKTEKVTKKQINKNGDKDELKNNARKETIVNTEIPITEKNPCHNEDNFTYEDDFEPMDDEETKECASPADNGIVPFAPVSKIEIACANHDFNQRSSVTHDHTEGDPDNTPRLIFMTDREIHAWHMDTVHGRFAGDIGRVHLSSTRSDVDFGYRSHPTSNDLVQSQSGYHPGYCLTHMHPSNAHVYDNLDQIPEYKRMKEKTKRKAGKRSDENEHVRRKPSNARKKTTVGYVPGYGAVRMMKEDIGLAYPGGRKRTSSNTSFPVIENQPKPGRTQRPVVGYVPGYGPVRGPPVQVFPEVPSERVVLPPLDSGQACSCNGDVKRSKKGRDKKRSEDLLENRARAKPFNTYVDEEASRRFERQYATLR